MNSNHASLDATHSRLLADYESRLAQHQLLADPAQRQAVLALAALGEALTDYETESKRWLRLKKPVPPKGLYLWGDVGRGKSLLMDMFFHHAPVAQKKRVHFHEFMRRFHAELHARQQANPEGTDPLPALAKSLAEEARLLCFDELQILDITDAMLIRRLFSLLLAHGVVMVMTSNRPPRDLYKDGLQRGQFLPFIEKIETRMQVLELAGLQDYRRRQLAALGTTYVSPLGPRASQWLDDQFTALTHAQPSTPLVLEVQGRQLALAEHAADIAKASFAQLCDEARGAGDYLALASRISTLLIADIPLLSPERRNAAKRFVTLIDVMYEARMKLLCTAAARPEALYPEGDGRFEFDRTVSRLIEMQSDTYMAEPWQRPDLALSSPA